MLSLGGLISSVQAGNLNFKTFLNGKIFRWWAGNYSGGTWTDELAKDNALQQSTAAQQPTLTTTPAGLAALAFDNSNDNLATATLLTAPSGANLGEYLYSICYKPNFTSVAVEANIDLVSNDSEFGVPSASEEPGNASKVFFYGNNGLITSARANAVVDGNWHNYIVVFNEVAHTSRMYIDGVKQTTTGTAQSLRTAIVEFHEVGAHGGTANPMNGVIASRMYGFTPYYFSDQDVVNLAAYQNSYMAGPKRPMDKFQNFVFKYYGQLYDSNAGVWKDENIFTAANYTSKNTTSPKTIFTTNVHYPAVLFNGTSDQLHFGAIPGLTGAAGMYLFACIFRSDIVNGNVQSIWRHADGNVFIDSVGNVTGLGNTVSTTSAIGGDGLWHRLICTNIIGGAGVMYIDGTAQTGTSTGQIDGTNWGNAFTNEIGSAITNDGGSYFQGAIGAFTVMYTATTFSGTDITNLDNILSALI